MSLGALIGRLFTGGDIDHHDFSDLGGGDVNGGIAVSRKINDFGLHFVGEFFALYRAIIGNAKEKFASPGVGKGNDVLRDSRGVLFFEFNSQALPLFDEEVGLGFAFGFHLH